MDGHSLTRIENPAIPYGGDRWPQGVYPAYKPTEGFCSPARLTQGAGHRT